MQKILKLLIEHMTIAVTISCITLIIATITLIMNRKKFSLDRIDFENRKSKFSLYLENSYRFQNKLEEEKFLLFDIRITNHSSTKNSLVPKLEIDYFSEGNNKNKIIVEHNPDIFDLNYHNNLTKLSREIRVDEKEIKSGWIIFKFPYPLMGKRINSYEISLNDSAGNTSKVICNLIKDIIYENK